MKEQYDFSDATKNPFAGKFNGSYTVTIHYDFTEEKASADAAHNKKNKEKRGGQKQA